MKTITVKDENGKEYTLEYTKASIMHMEKHGFNLDLLDAQPVLQITMLVQGAFIKNHPSVGYEKIDRMYKNLKNKTQFVLKLREMYEEQRDELVDEGNADWEANF